MSNNISTPLLDETAKRTRYDWLDNIKAFAMAFVVFAHLGLNGCSPFVLYTSFIKLPLFFAASGFVFNPKKNDSFKTFIITRAKRIVVPYLILSLILRLFELVRYNGDILKWLKDTAVSIGTGTIMWFLPTLFICNVLMYLVFKLSKNKDVFVIISAIASFVLGYFLISDKHIVMGANTAFIAYPMCIFGYYLKEVILIIEKKYLAIICVICSMMYIGLPLLYKYKNGSLNYINMFESKYCSYFYDMLIAYAGVLAFFIAFQFIKFPKFVTWFGKNTIFYYAFHVPACKLILFILSITISPAFTSQNLRGSVKGTIAYFGITIVTLILLSPICIFVNKKLPFIVGLRKNKK